MIVASEREHDIAGFHIESSDTLRLLFTMAIRSNPGPRSLAESSSILPSRSISKSQVMLFQDRMEPSSVRAINRPPSSDQINSAIAIPSPSSDSSSSPVSMDQTRTDPSSRPLTIRLPSGESRILNTGRFTGIRRSVRSVPSLTSHLRMDPSFDAVMTS